MPRARLKERAALGALAARAGILPEYVDQAGAVRVTSDETRVALLAAMGFDAETESRARAALRALDTAEATRLLAPTRVADARTARALPLRLRARAGAPPLRWAVEVRDESGISHRAEGVLRAARGRATVRLPIIPAPGYYRVTLRVTSAGRDERSAEQTLIVAPGRCTTAADLGLPARSTSRTGGGAAGQGVFGLLANLYTVRSARNWGVGDLTDLCDLVRYTGRIGGAFVGINPLHALGNVGEEVSPYSPLSRLYRNPLYLDVTAVPELLECPAAQARLASEETRTAIARLRAGARVDYAAVAAVKDEILRELHATFAARHRGRGTARAEAYARYRDAEGGHLVDFATFVTLRAAHPEMRDWRRWPARYRDSQSRAVEVFRAEHSDAVEYQCWLQFELERQLGKVAERARKDALALGVYQDLALGSSPTGADPWMFPVLFLRDRVSIGAPPDPFAPEGQNWGLPPLDPFALARDGYRYWIHLVRTAFRHAGALRIDHVMGLFRQFWIPTGCPGSAGAYVRMPSDDLLAILALESRRARALVIGEDLGTVPAGLPRALARWGVLSMRVLYFARDARGGFVPADRYPARALVSVNTHDMAPIAGYWEGRDLVLRRRTGQIPTDEALAAAERERDGERRALVRRFDAEGVLPRRRRPRGGGTHGALAAPPDPGTLSASDVCAAAHSSLSRTPAALVGLSLDDLAGEVDPVNLPGVGPDVYPSWTRKMRRSLETLARDRDVRRLLADAPALRGGGARARAPHRARRDSRG